MRTLIVIIALLFPSFAFAGENCTCRYKGHDVVEGDTICMRTPSGPQMAKCDRVLNNTSWKMLGTECPNASLERIQITPLSEGDLASARKFLLKSKS